jgi:glucose-1-phosphate cytidylyltransferase
MQVVIFCGGKGTRLMPYTVEFPKPMATIGDKPILYHVMRIYSHFGHKDFILCLGHLGEVIKEYFQKPENIEKDWNITFVDTGADTNTGGRLKMVESLIKGETFFATYADGLSDVDINDILRSHNSRGAVATLVAVKPQTHFGILEIEDDMVKRFIEKPTLDLWVNGGFFVFNRKIFDYIEHDEVLEKEVFGKLVNENQLHVYMHNGFWKCMDTFKDLLEFNQLWKTGPKWTV